MRISVVLSRLVIAALMYSACIARAGQTDISGPTGSVAFGSEVVVLPNGNFVVSDPAFSQLGIANVGAVYLYSHDGALISTLAGTTSNDQVGSGGIASIKGNSNFVVGSPNWNNFAGAVTWVDGDTGLSAVVSAANSLIGTTKGDGLGMGIDSGQIAMLGNGNCVIPSTYWTDPQTGGEGAATWIDGTRGIAGPITAGNSLLGGIVSFPSVEVFVLSNGNYVVAVPNWKNGTTENAGAVVWAPGLVGATGYVSTANALFGSSTGDVVGGVTALSNGNYVVTSPGWSSGSVSAAGAATWGDGSHGVVGAVGPANSLVGTTTNDYVGSGGVTALGNGHYVIGSQYWHSDPQTEVGAATWENGNGPISGSISATNSLIGSQNFDDVGVSVIALTNNNYVVASFYWNNGTQSQAGAVTWANGAKGIHGIVSPANSLIGTHSTDRVGTHITSLTDGNYVVLTPFWNDTAAYLGAVTWVNGWQPTAAPVSKANSLLGATAYDSIGYSAHAQAGGAYVILSPHWTDASGDSGAVTWEAGNSILSGNIGLGNSLSAGPGGATGYDVQALATGGYVGFSPYWSDGFGHAGATTWCGPTAPCKGLVTAMNSFTGFEDINDNDFYSSVAALPDGNYMIKGEHTPNGMLSFAGSVTLASGKYRLVGSVATWNSVLGGVANGGSIMQADYDPLHKQLVVGRPAENIVSLFTMDQIFATNFEP
jgi:hypothetical protein